MVERGNAEKNKGLAEGGWVIFFCTGDLISNLFLSACLYFQNLHLLPSLHALFLFKCTLFLKKYSDHLLHLRNQ